MFKKGSIVKSYYNEDTFKINAIRKEATNDNKFTVHMTSLSSGENVFRYLTYKKFSDEYYVVRCEGVGKEDVISSVSDFEIHVKFSNEEQQSLVINQDLTIIERQGNIDRLLEIGDFEGLRNYLGE